RRPSPVPSSTGPLQSIPRSAGSQTPTRTAYCSTSRRSSSSGVHRSPDLGRRSGPRSAGCPPPVRLGRRVRGTMNPCLPRSAFWRRLTRDLREHRKPPLVLVRRGLALLRDQRRVVAHAVDLGCEPVSPEEAYREVSALVSRSSADA